MSDPVALSIRSFDGAELGLRRYVREGRPRLILSHGNGFAIDGYRAFWSQLVEDFELVLFDLRNHGASGATTLEDHTIAAMAQDHAAVARLCHETFRPGPTFGVFHSVSAIAATLASSAQRLWDGVVLVDPPLVSSTEVDGLVRSADDRLAKYARGRMARFESTEELAATFLAGPGRAWAEGCALDMARAVTRPSPLGGVALICPGEYEARIYEQNAQTESFKALGAMKDPVAILGADPEAPRALHPAINSMRAAVHYRLPYQCVRGTSHMLQIEKPAASAGALRALLMRFGLA